MRRLPVRCSKFLLFAAAFLVCLPALAQVPLDNDTIPDSPDQVNVGGRRTTYSLRGSIKDSVTKKPLSNVRVFLQALTGDSIGPTYTNDSGNYAFQAVPGGYYTVECDLPGYQSTSEQVDVADGTAFSVDISLHPLNEGVKPPGGATPTVSTRDLSIPAKAQDSMEKGMRLLAKNDYSGSVKEFQHAIDAYPNYYEAYAKMGLAYMNMKDTKQAEPALRKSIELSKQKDVEAYTYLAKLLNDEKHFTDAEAPARKAVELDARSWMTNLELAIALYGAKQPGDAETYALASAQLGPDQPGTYILLTNIDYSLNKYQAVLGDMDAYLKLAPNGPAAVQMRAARAKVQKELASSQTAPAQTAPAQAQPSDAPTLRR